MLIGLNFVILNVPDMEEAKAFYTDKLGFETVGGSPDFQQFKQSLGSTFAIQLATEATPTDTIELWWLVDNADETYNALASQGVDMASPPTDLPFGRVFSIKDPAGHTLHMWKPATKS